jgi:hypothetical protein
LATSKWEQYQQIAKEAAREEIQKSSIVTNKIPEEPPKLVNSGPKRRKEYGSSNRPPFEGCTKEESDQIRDIVALRFAGKTLSECSEQVGVTPSYIVTWMTRHQDAFNIAEQQHLERCLRAMETNLWIIRTGLSEVGPRAVQTLAEIMTDKKATPGVRKDCAVQVLKLLDVDHSVTGGKVESLSKEFAKALRDARTEVKSDNIIEAEEAEVIEDDVE